MKIIATGDWHLGNLFHGNDRLPEHKHFLQWLLQQIHEQQPDALLVAGDVFDNGNPSAAAQTIYYKFLADATSACPDMQIIVTAGNHDSAYRLEAPRPMLARYKIEVRGAIQRAWHQTEEGGVWFANFDDLLIPVNDREGHQLIVLAVPYLRNDVVQHVNYSQGVMDFLEKLTARARELYPNQLLLMMAHLYAKGADIAKNDASEKIVIGGLEEVNMEKWDSHPDYMTCGHIHKRQHIWNTNWARYTGSVLPMSFAEKDYTHGVDLITFDDQQHVNVRQLVYEPQHKLRILPEDDAELTPAKLKKLINAELTERTDGRLDDHFDYVTLKVKLEKISNDDIKELENLVNKKNAVLCKIQKIIPQLDLTTITGSESIESIDDILKRDPMETLRETFLIQKEKKLSDRQETMLTEIINSIKNENND